jgi:hypothetical protein
MKPLTVLGDRMKKHTILMTALILVLASGAGAMTINGGAAWFNPSGVVGSGGVLFSLGCGQRVDDMVMANDRLRYDKYGKHDNTVGRIRTFGKIFSDHSWRNDNITSWDVNQPICGGASRIWHSECVL